MSINDEPFKIGEMVKLKNNLEVFPEYNGTMAEVVGELSLRDRMNYNTMQLDGLILSYRVRTFDGIVIGPRVDQIVPRDTPPLKVKEMEETI